MHTNRATVSVIVISVITYYCLALSGVSSPALAKTIVVTTLDDTAVPPFNADSLCGTGTISDLPKNGLISLHEAIIAANNTKGADTITFAPSLIPSGGVGIITVNFDDSDADTDPNPLPALCGGQTTINGDGAPDITLEGAALAFPAAGIGVISSHNTIQGLQMQHFPLGIIVQAGGDFPILGASGTVEHNTVTNNGMAESSFHGILLLTGDTPGSVLAHTTITQNLVVRNGFVGIVIGANVSGAGADTQITHTTMTDNEVRENGILGILLLSNGDRNVLSHATLSHNTVAGNTVAGILVRGGSDGADENTFETDIADNIVQDNGHSGIVVDAGVDNSSNNHVVAQIVGNTVERHQIEGIETLAGLGAVSFPTGTSNHNALDVRIERNTVRSQTGGGIFVGAGEGSPDGRVDAVADGNHTRAIVVHNTVEDNTTKGIELDAGVQGLANANTLDIRVAHNTVCHNAIADIFGEGGFSGDILFPAPNTGTGNVLIGEISQNTTKTVVVANGTPGNTATVTKFKNDPCP